MRSWVTQFTVFTARTYLSCFLYRLRCQWSRFCPLLLVLTVGSVLLSFTPLNHCLDTRRCIWSVYPSGVLWSGYVPSLMDHFDPVSATLGTFASVHPECWEVTHIAKGWPFRGPLWSVRDVPSLGCFYPAPLLWQTWILRGTVNPLFPALSHGSRIVFSPSAQSEPSKEKHLQDLSSSSQVSSFSKVLPFKFHFSP